jgi:hypothetical protein
MALKGIDSEGLEPADLSFLAEETRLSPDDVVRLLQQELVRT